jgi:hypothetical protein
LVAEGDVRWVILALVFENRSDHSALIGHASYAVDPAGRMASLKDGAREAVANYQWPREAQEQGLDPERLGAAWPGGEWRQGGARRRRCPNLTEERI